ncbi:MAG: phosphopentomutase [Bacillota bacterium]|nr:MAG: phosphopentomutase [Bacillota bacterium]
MNTTVVLIVLDSVGIGELPDAAEYGDTGSNTLLHVLEANAKLMLPNLTRLGLGQIAPHPRLSSSDGVIGAFGRGMTRSPGKDTITGHWEMAGIMLNTPFKTFPAGFPPEVIAELSRRTGKKFIGNIVASGTDIIRDLGPQHVSSGALIVYTSADSVMQIAAHEDILPLPEFYAVCQVARDLMQGDVNVARIIARPFTGEWPYTRTPNRKDYAVLPPSKTMLDILSDEGFTVTGIGKVCDIYSGRGATHCLKTKHNADGMVQIMNTYMGSQGGLVFANLVDYDMLYGHRNDSVGYGHALKEFDEWLPLFLGSMRPKDYLIIVADHGCDPAYPGTDHTREYVPILAYSPQYLGGAALGDRTTLSDIGSTIIDIFGLQPSLLSGTSFKQILETEHNESL